MSRPTIFLEYNEGAGKLDLFDQTSAVKGFALRENFTPPEVEDVPTFSGLERVDLDEVLVNVNVPLNVTASTVAEMKRNLRNLKGILARAGNRNRPLFLAWLDNSDVGAEPLWGQHGGYMRYPIKHGTVPNIDDYLVATHLATDLDIDVSLVVSKPIGLRQRFTNATGGIITCQKDGRENGTIVGAAITNIHKNPIFGHATFDNGWIVGGNLFYSAVTDKQFVRFGNRSVKITSINTTADLFTESLTLAASTHTMIYYIKLPDGTAPTSTEVEISYNGSDQTTSFVVDPERSDGWYIATAEVTGTGGAAATGIKVNSGYTVYWGMAAVAAVDYSFYPLYGEMVGCSWSSTPHASASTRVVGRIRVEVGDIFSRGQGTIVIAWRAEDVAAPDRGVRVFFEIDTLGVKLQRSNPNWTFTDGTNTATSAGEGGSSSYVEGSINIIHVTWDPTNGIAQYFNGVAMGTNATFTPGSTGTYMYIGTDASVANPIGDELLLVESYSVPMTPTVALAHYTNLASAVEDGDAIGTIPWQWDKDGDKAVDNCDDSTRDNWALFGGIPGSGDAEFEIRATLSDDFFTNAGGLYLSRLDMPFDSFFLPSGPLYDDREGVVNGDSSGGEYQDTTVGTSDTALTILSTATSNRLQLDVLSDKKYYAFIRLKDADTNLSIATRIDLASETFLSKFKAISPGTSFSLQVSEGFYILAIDAIGPLDPDFPISLEIFILAKRSTGSGTVGIDFFFIMPEPMIFFEPGSPSASDDSFLYDSATHSGFSSDSVTAATGVSGLGKITGDKFTLVPSRLNMILSVISKVNDPYTIATTMTYTETYVTPTWDLL